MFQCREHSVCPDDCRHFLAEIERVMDEVSGGTFIRISEGEDGALYRQKFENHEPVGEPVFFRRSWEEL